MLARRILVAILKTHSFNKKERDMRRHKHHEVNFEVTPIWHTGGATMGQYAVVLGHYGALCYTMGHYGLLWVTIQQLWATAQSTP